MGEAMNAQRRRHFMRRLTEERARLTSAIRALETEAELDVIEASEALAAQACAFAHEAGFDAARLNPNGAGISIRRPAR